MNSKRRGSDRPRTGRLRLGRSFDTLETRQMLTGSSINYYRFSDIPSAVAATNGPAIKYAHGSSSNGQLAATQNEGKVIQGRDRQGDTYVIAIHGPGTLIVTDTTPNDGVLDDDINTIQVIGTTRRSQIIAQTTASAEVVSDGLVFFNRLQVNNDVKSITLNGFMLTDTVTAPGATGLNSTTGVTLLGDVQQLSFTGINAANPVSQDPSPITITIGDPAKPLRSQPSIRIDRIYNTVYNDLDSGAVPVGPLTTPTVNIVINGEAKDVTFISAGMNPQPGQLLSSGTTPQLSLPPLQVTPPTAAVAYRFPITGVTGRTAVRAKAIKNVKVVGSATNTTYSKASQPFSGDDSGLNTLGSAQFGGTADAVALDVKGNAGKLKFARGAGNPTGTARNDATTLGTPADQVGYPGRGFLGVQVAAKNIKSVTAAAANRNLQVTQNPNTVQQGAPGVTTFLTRQGRAISSGLITSTGNIKKLTVVGDTFNSEIKAGYDLTALNKGLNPNRSRSAIKKASVRGNLVDAVVTSSYQTNGIYGSPSDVAGNGSINGQFSGTTYVTANATTPLGNKGAGFYARHKSKGLPPPQGVLRNRDSQIKNNSA